MIGVKMLESLRCPVGKALLEFKNDSLVCTSCGLIFSVTEGIPDLIIDDAVLPEGISNFSELKCMPVCHSALDMES